MMFRGNITVVGGTEDELWVVHGGTMRSERDRGGEHRSREGRKKGALTLKTRGLREFDNGECS